MKRLMLLLCALTLLFVALAKVKMPNRSTQALNDSALVGAMAESSYLERA